MMNKDEQIKALEHHVETLQKYFLKYCDLMAKKSTYKEDYTQ